MDPADGGAGGRCRFGSPLSPPAPVMAHSPAALLIVAVTSITPAPHEQGATNVAAAPEAPSLAGAFPNGIPEALDEDTLKSLGERWAAWSEATADAARNLFRPDVDADRQREAIATLRGAVRQLDAAAETPGYAAIRTTLREIRGGMSRWTELAAVTLDALAAAEEVSVEEARSGANARLGEAVTALRADLAAIPGGDRWLPVARADRLEEIAAGADGPSVRRTLTALLNDVADPTAYEGDRAEFLARPSWRRLSAAADLRLALMPNAVETIEEDPDATDAARAALRAFVAAFERFEENSTDEAARAMAGAAADLAAVAPPAGPPVQEFLDELYDGDNYRVAISEGFLRRFIAQKRRETGPVTDVVLGAHVRGKQVTNVNVDVDVKPEVGAARFDVTLNGVARTDTVARTREARVVTAGRHQFAARKTMTFDGTRFRGGRTVVDVDPDLRNTRIDTIYDDLAGGLFRDLIQREAFAMARRRRPASLLRTERELKAALRPQLDRQLTEQFDVVNLRVGGLFRRRAETLGVAPSRETISSTETELRMFGRLSNPDEFAAPPPPTRPTVEDGVVVQVHQSAINNAADRLGLAGRTGTPDELGALLTDFAGVLFGRDIPPPQPVQPAEGEEPPPTLTFASSDPIRVAFDANKLVLTLRVGLIAPPKADGTPAEDVPPQKVSIPFAVSLSDSGEVELTRGDLSVAPLGSPESRFRQQAIARVLRARLGDNLPEVSTVPATTVVATDAQTRVPLRLSSLELSDGWSTATLR